MEHTTKINTNTEEYAVAYMRYSSNNQDENSIAYQTARITSYCCVRGINIVKMYTDRAKTGTTDRREAFQQMIQDAHNNPVWKKILVFSFSRYFRNDSEALKYRNMLNDLGIEVISVTQEFGNTPEGHLMESLTYAIDAYQSNINALHTHSGMTTKATKSLHCGGKPPLGYDIGADKKLVINPYEADIVSQIFDMYENDMSYERMADYCNSKGYRTKAGAPFTKHSFNSLLQNEKYIGIYTWNKSSKKKSNGKRNSHSYKPISEQVRNDGGCPAIISKEQFDRVQKKLKGRSKGIATSKSRHHYMLSGLKKMKCAECGSYMQGTVSYSHGKAYTTYFCPQHKQKTCSTKEIRTEYVDKMVAGAIVKDLYNREDIKEISSLMKYSEDCQALKFRLRGIQSEIRNITSAIKKHFSPELTEELQVLAKEKKEVETEIEKKQNANIGIDENNRRIICNKFGRHLMKSDDPEIKEYICFMIHEILIDNLGVKVTVNEF